MKEHPDSLAAHAMITVAAEAAAAIRTHGAATYPLECCGALIGSAEPTARRAITEAWPLDNTKRMPGSDIARHGSMTSV